MCPLVYVLMVVMGIIVLVILGFGISCVWIAIRHKLMKASIVISLLGVIDALYLSIADITGSWIIPRFIREYYEQLHQIQWSHVFGIPISFFGLGFYIGLLALGLIAVIKPKYQPTVNMVGFGLTAFGVLFSIYLAYVSIFLAGVLCAFCVMSWILTATLFVFFSVQAKRTADIFWLKI